MLTLSTEQFKQLVTDLLNKEANALAPSLNTAREQPISLPQWTLTQHIESLVEKNPEDADALFLLGYIYEIGLDKKPNPEEAVPLYERAIALGSTRAMNARADMHERDESYNKAIALYERAIALGDTDAMITRARMHELGQGSPVDYSKAITLYEDAAKLGSTWAVSNLDSLYQEGHASSFIKQELEKLRNETEEKLSKRLQKKYGSFHEVAVATAIKLIGKRIAGNKLSEDSFINLFKSVHTFSLFSRVNFSSQSFKMLKGLAESQPNSNTAKKIIQIATEEARKVLDEKKVRSSNPASAAADDVEENPENLPSTAAPTPDFTTYSEEGDIGPPPSYHEIVAAVTSAPPQNAIEMESGQPLTHIKAPEKQASQASHNDDTAKEGLLLDFSHCVEPPQNYFSLFDKVDIDRVNEKVEQALEDLDRRDKLEEALPEAPNREPEIKVHSVELVRTILPG